MIRKLLRYISGEHRRDRKVVSALNDFLDYNKPENDLSNEEAKKNLQDGIVEIIENGLHSSNGLLLTDDGYFLTAEHCLEGICLEDVRIISHQGSIYPIEKIGVANKDLDIAVAKASMKENCSPKRYRIYDCSSLEENLYVAALSRWDGELKVKTGYTIKAPELKYEDEILSTVPVFPGYSGSTLINQNVEIMGIITSLQECTIKGTIIMNDQPSIIIAPIEIAEATSIDHSLELINSYKREVESKL